MTGANLYSYILRTFKRTDKSTEIYEAMTDTVLDVRRRTPWDKYKTVSTDLSFTATKDYIVDLPTDFGRLIDDVILVDSTGDNESTVLQKISKPDFDALLPYPDYSSVDTGVPSKYCIFSNDIYVYLPTDSTDYKLRINYSTENLADTDITSATDPVPFSDLYREMLKYGVLYRMYRDMQEIELKDIYQVLYEQEIQKLINIEKQDRDTNYQIGYTDI